MVLRVPMYSGQHHDGTLGNPAYKGNNIHMQLDYLNPIPKSLLDETALP